jgi:undecaprenyl-diphosphatase
MFGKDYWHDVTSVGSLFFFLLVIIMAFLLKQPYLATQLIIALVSCYIIGVPIKLFFYKERPNKQTYTNLVQKFDAASFPSVHSMRSMCLATIISFFMKSIVFSVLAFTLVIAVMYSRIRLHKHFVGDLLAGAAFGIMISTLVLWLQPAATVFVLLGL